ncbi:MAG: DegQ family serine endoprotease [Nitrospinae bacterium]|nr:DegQ family serine endoprotease [Nitrospinota bacterium]
MSSFISSTRAALTGLALVLIGAGGHHLLSQPEPLSPVTAQAQQDEAAPTNIFAKIAREQTPAVVNISTTQKAKRPLHPTRDDERLRQFYERFYGQEMPGEQERQSLGSGFVVEKDGFILTNYHVVKQADEIVVSFGNGLGGKNKEYPATLVGADPKTDIALIKIKPERDLPVMKLGDSAGLQVGEWVIAIGNPFGFSGSVTVGVVSAKGREIGAGPYDDFIQTDASINPGNSGGPLLNVKGEVVGINTAIFTGGMAGGNIGIGFATPINVAKTILADLKGGKVSRGWLGVMIQQITPEMKEAFGLQSDKGALVGDVVDDSPALKGGIRAGDVIVSFDGEPVGSSSDLPRMVGARKPGTKIKLGVVREGKEIALSFALGEMPAESAEGDDADAPSEEGSGIDRLGLAVEPVTKELARQLDLPAPDGIVITGVAQGGPAAQAGLRPRDVILEAKRTRLKSVAQFEKLVNDAKPGENLALLVRRGKATQFFVLTVPEEE